MGATKLMTAAGGGITLDAASTASDKTITVPADNGTFVYANSSGNVGIGTSSPSTKLDIRDGDIELSDSSYTRVPAIKFTGLSGSRYTYAQISADEFGNYNGGLIFSTKPPGAGSSLTERARIEDSGNLLVGTTSATPINARVNGFVIKPNGGVQNRTTSSNSDFALSSSSGNVFNFYSDNGSTAVYSGSVSVNGNTTSYTSVSDYRLKENVQPMAGALAKVQSLNPVTFTFKNGGQFSQGFIAHELQAVVPDAVTGEKDAVDADGNPVYQGIDTSFLVATLTAAIQELKAELDAAKADIAALKGTV